MQNPIVAGVLGIIVGAGALALFQHNAQPPRHTMADGSVMEGESMHQQGMASSSMDSMMADMTADLKGKTGPELEKAFLEEMIVHHQGAVDMAKELQKGTSRPELLKMANDIITVQTKEIDMMHGWLKAWFKQ